MKLQAESKYELGDEVLIDKGRTVCIVVGVSFTVKKDLRVNYYLKRRDCDFYYDGISEHRLSSPTSFAQQRLAEAIDIIQGVIDDHTK